MARPSNSTIHPLPPSQASVDGEVTGSASPFKSADRQGLTAGENEVIAIFVQMIQVLGLPRSLGEIYGLLFATPQPLAFQDIADRLGLSKGSVSQGLKFLRTVGAIKPVVVEGDRREFFEPVVELRALVSGFINQRLNPQLEEWGGRAKALTPSAFELNALSADQRGILEGRLDKLKTWQKRANAVLPMMGKLLG
jgi:HTH-type transcriptional regulator, glycine betaine synthesis regulator